MFRFIPNVSNYRNYCRTNALYNYLYRLRHVIQSIIIIGLAAPKNCSRCNLCPHLLQHRRICVKWPVGRRIPRAIMTTPLPRSSHVSTQISHVSQTLVENSSAKLHPCRLTYRCNSCIRYAAPDIVISLPDQGRLTYSAGIFS